MTKINNKISSSAINCMYVLYSGRVQQNIIKIKPYLTKINTYTKHYLSNTSQQFENTNKTSAKETERQLETYS